MGNEQYQKRKPRVMTRIHSCNNLPLHQIVCRDYDIENLVFAGGGIKALAYPGAVRVLELLGILPRVTRFTGVGTGAIVATLLAVGCDSYRTHIILNKLLNRGINEDPSGYADRLPKLEETYGGINGEIFVKWLAKVLLFHTDVPDLTFRNLYENTGNELCLVAVNLAKNRVEYFHPKTTPDLLICRALQASLSVPGISLSPTYKFDDSNSLYANGSLLCNYPIHTFDGWWLSMKGRDTLPVRMRTVEEYDILKEPFEVRNEKTLGFVLIDKYLEKEEDIFDFRLLRAGSKLEIPDTTLGKQHKMTLESHAFHDERYCELRRAFFRVLDRANHIDVRLLDIKDLAVSILRDPTLTLEEENSIIKDPCEIVIDFPYFVREIARETPALRAFTLRKILRPQTMEAIDDCVNIDNKYVKNLQDIFISIAHMGLNTSFKVKKSDHSRTVGIMTGHISSRDVFLAYEDEDYLYNQGWNATVAYFLEKFQVEPGNY